MADEKVYDVAMKVGQPFSVVRSIMDVLPAFTDEQIHQIHSRLVPSYAPVAERDIRQILEIAAEVR